MLRAATVALASAAAALWARHESSCRLSAAMEEELQLEAREREGEDVRVAQNKGTDGRKAYSALAREGLPQRAGTKKGEV